MKNPRKVAWEELAVPLVIVLTLGAYWLQAYDLSVSAKLFPLGITVAIVSLLAVQGLTVLRQARERNSASERVSGKSAVVLNDFRVVFARVVIIAVLTAAAALFEWLGVAVALYLILVLSLLVLGERNIFYLVALPLVITFGVVVLFQVALGVRFPTGPLSLLVFV